MWTVFDTQDALERDVDACLLLALANRALDKILARFDTTTFATLTAADYSANDQLAKLVGENDFSSLFHQGEKESIYVADIARRLLLVIIFDSRTTVGLVRLRMKDEIEELTLLVDRVFSRGRNGAAPEEHLLRGADDEIDKLFNW